MAGCARCGAQLPPQGRGRPRLYCSTRCKKAGRDRTTEYARRNAARAHPAPAPLDPLFPDLERGWQLVPRSVELARDLRQEAVLAQLEGRDVLAACKAYAGRERQWLLVTRWLAPEERGLT